MDLNIDQKTFYYIIIAVIIVFCVY